MTHRFKFFIVSTSTALVALLLMGSMMGRSASPQDAYKHLAVFTEVLSRIKSDYVEEPDLKGVTLGAVTGLLESIDPFASYLSAEQYKQYLQHREQKKNASVGLVLSKRFGYINIVDAIPGSPADKAGLGTGDMLETIKGIGTRDMPLAFAEVLLEGEAGSTIDVMVLRVRKPEPTKLTLTREVIAYPPVTAKLLPDSIGHLAIHTLESGKVKEVAAAVKSLERQGAKKLLLDLRHCAVGTPEDGFALANLFVDKGLLGYLQGQRVARQNFEAAPDKAITKLPMVVLTNRGTASGAEVAAAALLETKRAETVGERTYGDAAQRKALSMEDGSAVIIAVAKYYGPNGKAIQDNQVVPTVAVADIEPPAADDEDETTPPPPKQEGDPILKKGIEVLLNGVQKAKTGAAEQARSMTPLPR